MKYTVLISRTRPSLVRVAWLTIAITFLSLVVAGPNALAQEGDEIDVGDLWILRQYRVPGCEPMPRVPTVFNWLIRRALAVEQFIAASADCGQVGRRGAIEGWTYVFWTESENTALGRLLRRGEQRFGITRLVGKKMDESYVVHSRGYEPFIMIQLGGDQGPARVWAAGDVATLSVEISPADPDEFTVGVESLTWQGRRCRGEGTLRPDDPTGPREALPCRTGT